MIIFDTKTKKEMKPLKVERTSQFQLRFLSCAETEFVEVENILKEFISHIDLSVSEVTVLLCASQQKDTALQKTISSVTWLLQLLPTKS